MKTGGFTATHGDTARPALHSCQNYNLLGATSDLPNSEHISVFLSFKITKKNWSKFFTTSN